MLPILRFGVCRSSDLSIHVRRIFPRTNALLQPSLRAMTALPMTGFHRMRGFPRMENNTLESQLLSESCRTLAISNVQTAILRWIPSVSGIYTRFPCSANKNACPICRAGQGQSFHLDEATSVLRVAHVPQKPWYVILGTIAVVSCESSFAKLDFFGKRCIRSFHCFLRKQG